MAVDVTAQREIARPREKVVGFATDPANDPKWIGGISEAEMLTEPPVAVGTRSAGWRPSSGAGSSTSWRWTDSIPAGGS
jgi:uncharacterized protein YndB with AHSA1/START domain